MNRTPGASLFEGSRVQSQAIYALTSSEDKDQEDPVMLSASDPEALTQPRKHLPLNSYK